MKVPKLGVMLVGLGGNNGSTFTAGLIANKRISHGQLNKVNRRLSFMAHSHNQLLLTLDSNITNRLAIFRMSSNQLKTFYRW